jgi:hypothetical protein
MTKSERKILKPLIKRVARFNTDVWWELKQDIFDNGIRTFYPAQDAFLAPANCALDNLGLEAKEVLIAEWIVANAQSLPVWEQIRDDYSQTIVQEVVRRAIIAANRTDW